MTIPEFNKWAASRGIELIDEADGFKVGEIVTVINGYGIPYPNKVIKGIEKEPRTYGGRFYVWDDAYWFPNELKDIKKPNNMKEYTSNGIMYTWELASSEGASFILFPEEGTSKEEIEKAKQYLKNNQDVVWLKVANEDDRDYLYKSDYFRDPRTRPLKWYQIEQDEKLIRRERKKGTTPTDFVTNFVLPFIKQTEENMLEQHGENMYGI